MDLQKFTQKSLEVIQMAQKNSKENSNSEVDVEHILKALLDVQDSLIKELFKKMNVSDAFENSLNKIISNKPKITGGGTNNNLYVSYDANKVLEDSENEAKKMKDEYVSVEHIMISIFNNLNKKELKELFKEYKINKNEFLKVLSDIRGNQRVVNDNPESTYNVLEKYGQDLVKLAKEQKLDPVIGRDEEIRNVIRILSRKTKNNPVLIGEPGVGKTAIAEGLALRIVRGDVPEGLEDCIIVSLNMGAVVSGAKYRGEF